MAVLVTRPEPDNEATAGALRARGFAALLAPLLHFQPLPFRADPAVRYRGVIVTSANALRAIAQHPWREQLCGLPLFAVGERSAEAARASGFTRVTAAGGDVAALRRLIGKHAGRDRGAPLLYLAAADPSSDLGAELAKEQVAVATLTVYRMVMADELPADARAAFTQQTIEAVLHYSRRTAQAFAAAVRQAGLEVAALGVPQVCISEAVARALREAGAPRVVAAERKQEAAMLDSLERMLRPQRHSSQA